MKLSMAMASFTALVKTTTRTTQVQPRATPHHTSLIALLSFQHHRPTLLALLLLNLHPKVKVSKFPNHMRTSEEKTEKLTSSPAPSRLQPSAPQSPCPSPAVPPTTAAALQPGSQKPSETRTPCRWERPLWQGVGDGLGARFCWF